MCLPLREITKVRWVVQLLGTRLKGPSHKALPRERPPAR